MLPLRREPPRSNTRVVLPPQAKFHRKFPPTRLGVYQAIFYVHKSINLRHRPLEPIPGRGRVSLQFHKMFQDRYGQSQRNKRQSGHRRALKDALVKVKGREVDNVGEAAYDPGCAPQSHKLHNHQGGDEGLVAKEDQDAVKGSWVGSKVENEKPQKQKKRPSRGRRDPWST